MEKSYTRETKGIMNLSRVIDLDYCYNLYKIKDGIWCLAIENDIILGSTFLRCQEFYESPNPKIQNNIFTKKDYIKWYKEDFTFRSEFTYHDDWAGFNLPSNKIKECLELEIKDWDDWDSIMKSVYDTISLYEKDKWYLIGVSSLNDINVFSHEIAHALWYTNVAYKLAMLKLIENLPKRTKKSISDTLFDTGYAKSSIDDEIQAYFSTGLAYNMEIYNRYTRPFKTQFKRFLKTIKDKPEKVKIQFN